MPEEGSKPTAHFHLPGLFEFYELYRRFLPLYAKHREYFIEGVSIGSIYGSPAGCLWGGGRIEWSDTEPEAVLSLLREYHIPARLTFSNSLLTKEHLSDPKCNALCALFSDPSGPKNGVILHSDLLLSYLKETYPDLSFISSTTKVLTNPADLKKELDREDFSFVVPDFRLNRKWDFLRALSPTEKARVEFLCNECCDFGCTERKRCYETVSRQTLGEEITDHHCPYLSDENGYRFSEAMKNPGYIGPEAIQNIYLPMGFSNFKIEGRGLGSALILEFLLTYLVKPEYHLVVREEIYLSNMLDLF